MLTNNLFSIIDGDDEDMTMPFRLEPLRTRNNMVSNKLCIYLQ